MKKTLVLLTLIFVANLLAEVISVQVPEQQPDTLIAYSTFNYDQINESSALEKSKIRDDVYWTLNDSGDHARIFPFNANGEVYYPLWDSLNAGISIPNAVNIDWESMTTDNDGNLVIGACGNNMNMRRDLALYIFKEPYPTQTSKTRALKTIPFYYPDQTNFPPEKRNFDCEAIFSAFGKYYFLTKHRSDYHTTLYRMDQMNLDKENALTKLAEFDIQGMVTGADASDDGKMLAILTYGNVWLFISDDDDYFNGKIYYKAIRAKQCEAICIDGDNLMITNEQKELFRLPINELTRIK